MNIIHVPLKSAHLLRRAHVYIKHIQPHTVIENSVLALLNQYQSSISCKIAAYARHNNNNNNNNNNHPRYDSKLRRQGCRGAVP